MQYKFNSVSSIPRIFYGTAWKKERTAELVTLALKSGFRAIDTACQPKHYSESGVGDGIQAAIRDGVLTRTDLFLQTKFTSHGGQDPFRVPYDVRASLPDQVRQSFDVSLHNLHTDYIDSLVMHSPMETVEKTIAVWRVFEELHAAGRVKYLGISNIYSLDLLRTVYDAALIKPTFIQNRFYEQSGHDVGIRAFCDEHLMKYQSFWTLTAHPAVHKSDAVSRMVAKYHRTPAQLFYQFVHSIGIIPLSGTTSAQHMAEDVAVLGDRADSLVDARLAPEEVAEIKAILKIP